MTYIVMAYTVMAPVHAWLLSCSMFDSDPIDMVRNQHRPNINLPFQPTRQHVPLHCAMPTHAIALRHANMCHSTASMPTWCHCRLKANGSLGLKAYLFDATDHSTMTRAVVCGVTTSQPSSGTAKQLSSIMQMHSTCSACARVNSAAACRYTVHGSACVPNWPFFDRWVLLRMFLLVLPTVAVWCIAYWAWPRCS